jgi:hypothetical protein
MLVMIVCSFPFAVFAQQDTIPERVAASRGKPVIILLARDLEPVPLADLASGADLIAYGKLVRQRSYLTDAETDVYTDYILKADRVILERGGSSTVKSQRPIPPMIVTVYGGELVVDGTHVRFEDKSLIKWNEGANLLMFLKRVKGETNRFEPYGGSAGLFQVEAGQRIKSLLHHGESNRELGQATLDDVVQRIREQTRR